MSVAAAKTKDAKGKDMDAIHWVLDTHIPGLGKTHWKGSHLYASKAHGVLRACCLPAGEANYDAVAVGRALLGTIRICDDEGNELPVGEAGTIFFEAADPDAPGNAAASGARIARAAADAGAIDAALGAEASGHAGARDAARGSSDAAAPDASGDAVVRGQLRC